jgi:hypothetical protein
MYIVVSGRVRIGTCSDPTDAAFVQSMFDARGIATVIGAQHHASLLGPIGSAFLSLDIWVDADDAEEATALLRDLREHDASQDAGGDGDAADGAGAGATPGPDDDDDDAAEGPDDAARARTHRRRAIVAVMFGTFVTFGAAHLVTGAWLRGLALAAIEILGIRQAGAGDSLGIVAIVGAIIADLTGTMWRLRAASRTAIPVARARAKALRSPR